MDELVGGSIQVRFLDLSPRALSRKSAFSTKLKLVRRWSEELSIGGTINENESEIFSVSIYGLRTLLRVILCRGENKKEEPQEGIGFTDSFKV